MIKLRQKTKTYANCSLKEKDSTDESDEEMELFAKYRSKRKEVPTIEKFVEDGDTLQSLALRYGCSIADIKRLNNIYKENEIFAKRTIRVPHKPFSMALADVHVSGKSSPNSENQPATINLINIESLNTKLNNNILIVPNDSAHEVNQIIFNSHINQKPWEQVQEEVSCDEEVQLLPSCDRETRSRDDLVVNTSRSRADVNVSWVVLYYIIVCIVVIIFAIPIYIFYIAEHNKENQNHQS